jgi:signal transduction histidine kinase/DNA-binding response OmpR family regulator/ligand-binding sensor domain-containing protein
MKKLTQIVHYLLVALVLNLLSLSCNQQPATTNKPINQEQIRNFLPPTNWFSDTIFTGVSHPIEFEEFNLDTLPKPEIVPLSRNAREVKAYSNTYPVIPPKVSLVPEKLNPVTLSDEGLPIPSKVSFRKEVVPAKFPEPVKAPRLFMKEDARFNIQSLNLDDGALDRIMMVAKDLKDNLWIGTQENGVSCYDGQYITTFRVGEGLNSNNVASVLADTKGNIWLLSGLEVLTKFDGETFTHYYLEGFKNSGGVSLFSMVEDEKGNIWIVFSGSQALVRYQPGNGKRVESFAQYPLDRGLTEVFKDSKGYLWIGTNRGALRFDGKHFYHIGQKEGLSDKGVFSINEDKHGNIWMSGRQGLYKYEYGSEGKRDKISGPYYFEGIDFDAVALTEFDKTGHLWCALYGDRVGVGRLNMDKSGEIVSLHFFGEEEGLTNNRTEAFMQQKDWAGNIWIGTKAGGLNLYGKNQFQFFSKKEGLSSDIVSTIKEDINGDLWFSIFLFGNAPFFGVNRYDPDAYDGQGSFTHITYEEGLITNSIIDILPMENGDVWFGSGYGGGNIGILSSANNKKEERFTNFYPARYGGFLIGAIWSLEKDKESRIWTNNYSRFELNGFGMPVKYRKYDIHLRTWKDIAEDLKGSVWFGVPQVGAMRLDPQNNTYTIYSKNEGLSAFVEPMLRDSHGNMWFGTLGDGLKYIDRESFESGQIKIKTFNDPYGFLDEYIFSLQEDRDKNIWISAGNGIGVLVPPSKKGSSDKSFSISDYTYYHFGKDEGLKFYSFSYRSVCLDQNNQLWWGTQKGAVRLDLDELELPEIPPQNVRLSHLTLDNRYIDFRSLRDTSYQNTFSFGKKLSESFDSVSLFDNYPLNLSLPFRLNHLTFYFSAQDWAAPNQLRYSYMFEGLDDDWSEPQEENKVEFRNIPAGKHVLKIKAIGAARKWSETFEYPFTIRPPWWQTTWAYLGYALVIGLLGYWLYQFLLNRRLDKEEARRLRELDEVKTQLYTNITHEFRTPLTIILGMTDKMKKDPTRWFNEGLGMIRRNGQQLLQLINQILDLRKLEAGKLNLDMVQADIIPFLQYHLNAFQSLAAERNIRLHFITEEKEVWMDFAPQELGHIMNNLLSNAIKYNKEGGDVYVSIAKVDERSKREAATPIGGWGAERAKSNTNQFLRIKIRDTGIGIPPDQLPYIFDRFYQVDSEAHRQLSKAGPGSGIGLALSKELAALMQADLSVHSQLDEGTTFSLSIPLTHEKERVSAKDMIQKDVGGITAVAAKPQTAPVPSDDLARLLIIEDNKDVVRYLSSCLEDHYQLEVSYNGAEGMASALEEGPDLIISDVMMPEKDGFEVCETLKEDIRTSHIPIILLTAKGDLDSKLKGLKHGADAYLTKPFQEEELLVRAEQLIQQRRKLRDKYSSSFDLDRSRTESADPEEQFLFKIRELVLSHLLDETYSIQRLCRDLQISRTQLHMKLKALTGKSTSHVIRDIKLEKARQLLRETDLNISEIAYQVGFSRLSYFTKVFTEAFNQTPSEYRKE